MKQTVCASFRQLTVYI